MTDPCPYMTLDVSVSASITQIKYAYTAKSERYHPDKHPGNEGLVSYIIKLNCKLKEIGD